jgi:hypothetical protein
MVKAASSILDAVYDDGQVGAMGVAPVTGAALFGRHYHGVAIIIQG